MNERGQATLEFLVISVAFIVITVVLALLTNAISDGALVQPVTQNAPYSLEPSNEQVGYALLF